jgi:uncharacterized protein (TIGR04141 family)
MAEQRARQESLAIYLAKKGAENPADIIKGVAGLRRFDLVDDDGPLGSLFVQAQVSKPPSWASFFSPQVSASELGRVSSTAAVLHVVTQGRAFLLPFGQGWHLLDSERLEERFGLKVTLNSIGESQVRSIDKHTLDTVGRHTRVQATKETAPRELGIDIERDLLKAITGTPTDQTLGKTLSGFDSLHPHVQVDLGSLRQLLSRYLAQSEKSDYQSIFPWVDHISAVKDPILQARLDSLMLRAIAERRSDICWLAVPEPIEWMTISGFRHAKGAKAPRRHDIHLDGFIEDNGVAADAITVEFLRKHKISAEDGNDHVRYAWSAYKCLYCEIEDSGQTYILSDGKWYHISKDFVDGVNTFYNSIQLLVTDLPEYDDDTETDYNKRVAGREGSTYALMDRELISTGGGYSKIEFCDLYGLNNDLVHVKRYGGSGVLSHLFLQGVVSGEVFVSDAIFRQKVCDLLPPSHRLRDAQPRPDTGAFRIIFAVVSAEKGDTLTLPFFSRLSLRHAMQTLDNFGYKTALAKIQVSDERARTQRLPAPRRRS